MLASARKIHGIIGEQIDKGIPSERIILGGFSQGGAIALLVPSPFIPISYVLTRFLRLVLHVDTNLAG